MRTAGGTPALCAVWEPDAHAVSRGASPHPHTQLRGAWEPEWPGVLHWVAMGTECRFPPIAFLFARHCNTSYVARGGGCGRIVGRRREPACTLNTPGSWGGAGGNGRARASAEVGGVELRLSRSLARQRWVCMQGRAGPSGREAPSPGP